MNKGPAGKEQSSAPIHKMLHAIPPGVWVLGFGSLFMDASSELIHSLLPVYMSSILGASMATIGFIEGIAEATAAMVKVFSGVISDHFRKRKVLLVLGYGLAAITKPVFPLASSIGWVFTARFVDRIGKGIRGAPRDALVADITPPGLRGAAYGLRQSLDTIGAFIGPLLALALMAWFDEDIRKVLWFAVAPAFVAIAVLVGGIREPDNPGRKEGRNAPLGLADARRLPRRYWLVVAIGAVSTLARFSEAFLVLRAQDVGLSIGYVPVVMIVMNVVYAFAAYPAGIAADRFRPQALLILGLGTLIAADLLLAAAEEPGQALAGAAVWGLHMGLTQGLFSKLVADAAPPELRGTAFGVFNLVAGGALLLASVIAGSLWNILGAPATFIVGAFFAGLAAMGVMAYR